MILREIDFQFELEGGINSNDEREFRKRINYIIDSIYFHMPKKIRTSSVIKLNCHVGEIFSKTNFWAVDGIGMAYSLYPNAKEILSFGQEETVAVVIHYLKEGVKIAAQNDEGINENIYKIVELIESSKQPSDWHRDVKRSHRSRKYKCEGIVHLQPNVYISEVLVSDKYGNTERIKIKEVEPILGCVDLGFDKLLWEGDEIIGMNGNFQAFKLSTNLISN